MSGFLDDKASGGGEVQPQVYVPNPSAVKATVKSQISAAEQSTDAAIQAAKAGFKEEGLRLIEDVLDELPNDTSSWNTKGLIHGMRGELEESAVTA